MDRANLELARFLAAEYPVHLVAHRVDPELAAMPNVTVHGVPRPFGKHLLGQPLLARVGRFWAKRLSREGFRVVVNGGNCRWPDVNWVHYLHAAAPVFQDVGRLSGIIKQYQRRVALRDERVNLCAGGRIVCNSRMIAHRVIECLAVPSERVHTVYCGTDPARFTVISPAERASARRQLGRADRPAAIFIGALGDRRKGIDTLYAAWRQLCSEPAWDVDLVIVGTGRELPLWRERATGDGLADRVHFLGFRTDVPVILAACDLLVHPARYEPYGLGVHEALCRGLPAIVSSACGISERYPPELGDLILQDPEDVGELVDRLRHWRAHLESCAQRVRPFSDQLRSRTWADMARDIRDLVLAHP